MDFILDDADSFRGKSLPHRTLPLDRARNLARQEAHYLHKKNIINN